MLPMLNFSFQQKGIILYFHGMLQIQLRNAKIDSFLFTDATYLGYPGNEGSLKTNRRILFV
jgi:hypothetical protein